MIANMHSVQGQMQIFFYFLYIQKVCINGICSVLFEPLIAMGGAKVGPGKNCQHPSTTNVKNSKKLLRKKCNSCDKDHVAKGEKEQWRSPQATLLAFSTIKLSQFWFFYKSVLTFKCKSHGYACLRMGHEMLVNLPIPGGTFWTILRPLLSMLQGAIFSHC